MFMSNPTKNGGMNNKTAQAETSTEAPSLKQSLREARLAEIAQNRREERDAQIAAAAKAEGAEPGEAQPISEAEAPPAEPASAPAAPEGETPPAGKATDQQVAEAAEAAQKAQAQTRKPAKGAPEIVERDGSQYVKFVIDGQQQEVPLDEALRRAAKYNASEKRMAEASRREQHLRQRETMVQNIHLAAQQRLAELEQRRKALEAQPTPQAPSKNDEQLAQGLHSGLKKLYDGDIDTASKELLDILGRMQKPATPVQQVNPDEIARRVETALLQRQEAERQARYNQELVEALDQFNQEYPDLATDPVLSNWVDAETARIDKERPGQRPIDVIRQAVESVQSRLTPASPSQSATRQARKESAPKPVTGMRAPSVSTSIKPPPPRLTPSDVIAKIKQARGQRF